MNLGLIARLCVMVLSCTWCLSSDARPNAPASVELTTDKSDYRKGEAVLVQIRNHLASPIYVLSGQTYCTILMVERIVNEEWRAEGRCRVLGPPGWVEIIADATLSVEIKPILPADQALIPGRHRIKITFNVGSRSGPTQTGYSPDFQINNTTLPQ